MSAEEKLTEIQALVAPQWRSVPVEDLPDSPVEAFSMGRNWMIDRIREVLDRPTDDPTLATHPATMIGRGEDHIVRGSE